MSGEKPRAYPVVYLLMRRRPSEKSGQQLLRTKINFGVVNNQTRFREIEKDSWKLVCIIGPFDSLPNAESFYRLWVNINETGTNLPKGQSKACRGNSRVARGMILSTLWNVHLWVDFAEVFDYRGGQYRLKLDGKTLSAVRE